MPPPCDECGVYHRYGTTDPEHEHSYVACVNFLVPEIQRLRTQMLLTARELDHWSAADVATAAWMKSEALRIRAAVSPR